MAKVEEDAQTVENVCAESVDGDPGKSDVFGTSNSGGGGSKTVG